MASMDQSARNVMIKLTVSRLRFLKIAKPRSKPVLFMTREL